MWPIPEIACQEEEENAVEDAVEEAEEGREFGQGWVGDHGGLLMFIVLSLLCKSSNAQSSTRLEWGQPMLALLSHILHTYMHTYESTYVGTYVRTYIDTYMDTCIDTCIDTYIDTYI